MRIVIATVAAGVAGAFTMSAERLVRTFFFYGLFEVPELFIVSTGIAAFGAGAVVLPCLELIRKHNPALSKKHAVLAGLCLGAFVVGLVEVLVRWPFNFTAVIAGAFG